MPRPTLDYAADLKRRLRDLDQRIAKQITTRSKLAASYRLLTGQSDAFGTADWQQVPIALDVSRIIDSEPDRI